MVKRHKRRKFSGRVCEQIVYTVAGGTDPKTSRPKKPRFQSQEEYNHRFFYLSYRQDA